MKKKLFFSNSNYKLYFIFFIILSSFIALYFVSFFYIINKKLFIISNINNSSYYIIPEDREGEKVKFINKKSINNQSNLIVNDQKLSNISDLNFTIQLQSDSKYENIKDYYDKLLNLKSEIISINELYIFALNSQIGVDYFITYKNFSTKSEAMYFCKKLSFIKKCLILNPQI